MPEPSSVSMNESNKSTNDRVVSIVLDQEDITWQQVLYDLIKKDQMDPWDIDIAVISSRFLEVIKTMKQNDLRVPAKMILCAAVLLKIKSNRLVGEDLDVLDQLFASAEESDEVQGLFDETVDKKTRELNIPDLIPRTPQPRKRKVSIYDLVHALENALETKKRRVNASMPDIDLIVPTKTRDISSIITDIYVKIKRYFIKSKKDKVTFSQLVPSNSREDKVYTFIPLLHLANQRKIDIEQENPFGEIEIFMVTNNEVNKDLQPEKAQNPA